MIDEIIGFTIIAAFIALIFVPLYFRKKELDKECKDVMNKTMDNWKYLRMLVEQEQEKIRKQKEQEEAEKK